MTDALEELKSKLGPETGQLAKFLWDNVTYLRWEWRTYNNLFLNSPKRRQFLFEELRDFSMIVERSLLHSVLTRIRAVTDRPKDGERNISLWQILEWLSERVDGDSLSVQLDSLAEEAKSIRTWVNKRIAHHDYDVRSGKRAISSVKIQQISEVVERIDSIFRRFLRDATSVEYSTNLNGGPHDEFRFVELLFQGTKAFERLEEEYRRLMDSGRYLEASKLFDRPEWLTEVIKPK